MKNGFLRNKGISMTSLVITIIVIIILVAVTIRLAFPTVEKANYSEFANQITSIESKTRTMQLQIEKEKRSDYSLEALGFKKVTLNKVPWNYRSVDEDKITGYVVDLDVLGLNTISRGRDNKTIGTSATFGEDDIFIIDAIGKAYYLKGFVNNEDGTSYYNTYTTQSVGVSGPRISNSSFELINDNQAAIVYCNVTSELGKQLTVYIGGERATNVSGSRFETIVYKNGKFTIRAQEADGLLAVGSVAVSGIELPEEVPTPAPTEDPKPTGPSKTTLPTMTIGPGKTTKPTVIPTGIVKPTVKPTVVPTGDVIPTPTTPVKTKVPTTIPSPTPVVTQEPTPAPVNITVNVFKDDEPWENSGMRVYLYQDGVSKYSAKASSGTKVTFSARPGNYDIYADEMVELNRVAYNTGISINATQDTEAIIYYYYITRPTIAKGTSLYVKETDENGRSITYGYAAPSGAGALSGIGIVLKGVPVYAIADKYETEATDAFLKINDKFVESPTTIVMSEPLNFETVAGYRVAYDANGGELGQVPAYQVKLKGTNLTLTEEVPTRDEWVFKGWATTSDATTPTYTAGQTNTYTADAGTTLYAVWGQAEAQYLSGIEFNKAIKKLAGTNATTHDVSNTTITSIKFQTTKPSDTILNADTTKNIGVTTLEPIYAWFDEGTIRIWSEAEQIKLPNYCSYLFYRLKGLTSIDIIADLGITEKTSNIDRMYGTFGYCEALTSLNLNNELFDSSNVTDMSYLFAYCKKLTTLDISNLDTRSAENMSYTFYGCSEITSLNVTSPKFNTSNVANMRGLFDNCSKLTSLDLTQSNFNTSKVTAMNLMFYNCKGLTTLDLSSNNFDTSKVTTMESMFGNCSGLTSLDLTSSNFDTSLVTSMSGMFRNCSKLTTLDLTSSNFNTSKVTDMSSMFSYCKGLTSLDLTSSNFDTKKVTNMSNMFSYCEGLTELDLSSSNFNTSAVTNMSSMFYCCKGLSSIDLSTDNFNTSNVTDMSTMFGFSSMSSSSKNGGPTEILFGDNFITSKVRTMNGMFRGCDRLTYLPLNMIDTSSVTDMAEMFSGVNKIEHLDLSTFDTSKVKNMSAMFKWDKSLRYINTMESFVTTAVTNSQDMFGYMGVGVLNGGSGTVYSNSNPTDKTYAHWDGGPSNPGYFRMPK